MTNGAAVNTSECPYAVLRDTRVSSGGDETRVVRLVVGDRIKDQLPDPRVMTVDEAELLVAARTREQAITLHIGQGPSHESLRRLYSALKRDDVGAVDLVPAEVPAKASSRATHKRVESNILITPPVADGHGAYWTDLLIDERCAEMCDHLTGEHVPGMAIAEAARQMIIAVTEEFFVAKEWKNGLRFVTHRMDIEYAKFLVPLAAQLRYVPVSVRRASAENMRFGCEVHILQLGHVVAVVQFSYSTLNRAYLQSVESLELGRALSAVCGSDARTP